MSQIVLGICTSHTPMLALDSAQWEHRAKVDRNNPSLNMTDGRDLTYEQLLLEVGGRYDSVVDPETLSLKEGKCELAVERLADELERAAPDVVLIIGDDQRELFDSSNQPAIAVFHGEEILTHPGKYGANSAPDWMKKVGQDYLMDDIYRWPGHSDLSLQVIQGLIERGVDVATIARIADPARAGFGHAFGFVIKRLFKGRRIPVVPLMLNTYFPPNVPTADRCYLVGRLLREAIEASGDLRVAIIGSGGLSHFVIDEELDRRILAALANRQTDVLRSVPAKALRAGTSEILNWIMTAGAVEPLSLVWSEYQPLYRTPAGTGTGAGFCIWRAD